MRALKRREHPDDVLDTRMLVAFVKVQCPSCKAEFEIDNADGGLTWSRFLISDLVCQCGHVIRERVAEKIGLKVRETPALRRRHI